MQLDACAPFSTRFRRFWCCLSRCSPQRHLIHASERVSTGSLHSAHLFRDRGFFVAQVASAKAEGTPALYGTLDESALLAVGTAFKCSSLHAAREVGNTPVARHPPA